MLILDLYLYLILLHIHRAIQFFQHSFTFNFICFYNTSKMMVLLPHINLVDFIFFHNFLKRQSIFFLVYYHVEKNYTSLEVVFMPIRFESKDI